MILAVLPLTITLMAGNVGQRRPELTVTLPAAFTVAEASASLICRNERAQWDTVSGWREVPGDSFAMPAPSGRRCRVLIRTNANPTYIASPEIVVATGQQSIDVRPERLRTIEAPPATGDVRWVSASGLDNAECESLPDRSRCWFVTASAAGVMIAGGRGSLQHAVVPGGSQSSIASWATARWGRVVRVRAAWSEAVEASMVVLRPSLKHGNGQMIEASVVPEVSVHRLSANAFWIEGEEVPGSLIELRSAGAAVTRIPVASLNGEPGSALDVSMSAEETITGDVRSNGALVEGVTVMLTRVLDAPSRPGASAPRDEDRPLERIDESITGATGAFSFSQLPRGRYELIALHPTRGRARAVVSPPAHTRLLLQPRTVIRGRVMQNGIGVPDALVQVLPALEAVRTARNPAMLGSEAVRTAPTGRFEVVAPDEGRVVLSASAEGASVRVDLGDVAALGDVVDIGDIKLAEPGEVEIVAELPAGCSLQAAGPMGTAGLSVIKATPRGQGRWVVRPPAAGRWLFAAICADRELTLEPAVVEITAALRDPIVLRVRR